MLFSAVSDIAVGARARDAARYVHVVVSRVSAGVLAGEHCSVLTKVHILIRVRVLAFAERFAKTVSADRAHGQRGAAPRSEY